MISVLKFESDNCRPCVAFRPVFEEFVEDHGLSWCVVDADLEPEYAEKYRVRSLPTTIFERDGEEYARYVGVQPRSALEAAVKTAAALVDPPVHSEAALN